MLLTKVCTKCGRRKPLTKFSRNNSNKTDGRRGRCKACDAKYRQEHSDMLAERQRRSYRKHREERTKYQHRRYKEHKGRIRAGIRAYKAAHPKWAAEKDRAAQHRRNARKRDLLAALTNAQWQEILEEWGFRCAYCGKDEGQLDGKLQQEHVIPVIQGGGYTLMNTIPACPRCNFKKGARTPEQAGMNFMPVF